MARPVWKGSLNFGLVTVPVQVFSATGDHTIHFRQFERGTSDRVRYRRVNERTGEEVDYHDLVRGYDLGGGEYVQVEQSELAEVAPGRSRTIDIRSFIDPAEIDPLFFQKSYWLTPGDAEFARPYAVLAAAMAETGRGAVASFVMCGREHIALVRATEALLTMDTLLFAEDVRDPETELGGLPELPEIGRKERDMAVDLIESMSTRWQPEDYPDTSTQRVRELIEDKKAGRTVTVAAEAPEPTNVVDLTEALSASIQRHGGKSGKPSRRRSGQRSGDDRAELAEASKSELARIARELAVAGRSKMSRAELVEAIEAARSARKRAS
ncbi:Ku protein [Amycolatopsis cihanbeyliensis]|uniref:Non-homologous end joining protein Ku n=1 Tax=Amycolatopsis cihanbeyliensis TaxID=1128664 RepID=A0A542DD44_AMYCI|nr:Ku protein [Amycolatopsis cihanbeyliensis]TQJ00982.1 DNA end-binding protein Ku [Amycolatopsis cihanbeyliensis]